MQASTLPFTLDPSTTALIAIDMQRDFCCEDGYVSRQPRSPPAGTRHYAVSLLSAPCGAAAQNIANVLAMYLYSLLALASATRYFLGFCTAVRGLEPQTSSLT